MLLHLEHISINPLRLIFIFPVFLLMLLLTHGCSGTGHDARLDEIAGIVNDSALLAVTRLDNIDPASLSDHDRHYYDLLSVKARDKAYMPHCSDSLINEVIDYYSSHRYTGLYPEALYYGGRVNRDLGDYPTALRYFQDALDEIADDESLLELKGYVVSQTGGLLNQLRLYSQAIPYVKESIRIDSLTSDTSGLAYDHCLLGAIHMHREMSDSADAYFKKSVELASNMDIQDQAGFKVYLAANQYLMDNTDSALSLIRGLPEICDQYERSFAIVYAARIYLQAGILDSAYMYALELSQTNCSNQKTGYQLLLSPELSKLVPPDSIWRFVAGFRSSMEEYLDKNEAIEAIMQNSYYNYSKHVRDKERLAAVNERIRWGLSVAGFIAIALFGLVFYMKYRNARQTLKLRQALDVVTAVTSELEKIKTEKTVEESPTPEPNPEGTPEPSSKPTPIPTTTDKLRARLKEQVIAIEKSEIAVPEEILRSEVRATLMKRIQKGESINETDQLWGEIESFILSLSPEFIHTLEELTNGKLKQTDLQIALLVRLGIPPAGMGTLVNISPGSVSSRRRSLCKRIFGEYLDTTAIDNIIRLL